LSLVNVLTLSLHYMYQGTLTEGCSTLGWAPALPVNTRLRLKGLPGTNTLAYYENLQITAVKSLTVQAPGVILTSNWISINVHKLVNIIIAGKSTVA
jgi:hypothetical protein